MSKKITDLTALTSADSTDVLPIVDISANTTKKVTVQGLVPGMTVFPSNLAPGQSSSTWTYQSWTPTWTNLVVGNGTVSAKYSQTGKNVSCRITLTFGSTTSISGTVSVSLPVTASSDYTSPAERHLLGFSRFYDASVPSSVTGAVQINTTTTVLPSSFTTSGTKVGQTAVSATDPITFTTSDLMLMHFMYEAA